MRGLQRLRAAALQCVLVSCLVQVGGLLYCTDRSVCGLSLLSHLHVHCLRANPGERAHVARPGVE